MNDYLFSVEPDFPCLFPVSNNFEYRHPGINKMPHAVSSSLNHSLPAILCLNGAGTSAAIFEAQTRNIRASLRSHYRFIYLDAPYDSSPGPGVVPCFEDSGPFYSWICDEPSLPTPGTAVSGLASLSKYFSTTLSHQGAKTSDIVGVMGFSQGTIVASLLLLQAQWRDVRWSGLQFGVMLSGDCREDFVQAYLGQKLRIPTVHVHGLREVFGE
jgi:pimeloyl-ACP methyl ester carboxylesterase